MIVETIVNQYETAKSRGWEKTYWFIDIHGTIMIPNYKLGHIPNEFYDNAIDALKTLSARKDICLILYTCSHPNEILEYLELFKKLGINFDYVNKNPEVKTEGYGYYEDKPYFNILLDDKAGFVPSRDWGPINQILNILPLLSDK